MFKGPKMVSPHLYCKWTPLSLWQLSNRNTSLNTVKIPHKMVCYPASDGYDHHVIVHSCTVQCDSWLHLIVSYPPVYYIAGVEQPASVQHCNATIIVCTGVCICHTCVSHDDVASQTCIVASSRLHTRSGKVSFEKHQLYTTVCRSCDVNHNKRYIISASFLKMNFFVNFLHKSWKHPLLEHVYTLTSL